MRESIKILIIGNGFDLAHDLPTKYGDFLTFCELIIMMNSEEIGEKEILEKIERKKINQELATVLVQNWKALKEQYNQNILLVKLNSLIFKNKWFKYLDYTYANKRMIGQNWIDFEYEISKIIQVLDNLSQDLSKTVDDSLEEYQLSQENSNIYTSSILEEFLDDAEFELTLLDLRTKLYADLQNMIHALGMYLELVEEKVEVKKKSVDIDVLKPDYVISFNYTNTYKKYYETSSEIFHIHGKIGEMNMVLGIDEYWEGQEKNKYTNYSSFKKFVQRIQKNTGNYYKYVNELRNRQNENRSRAVMLKGSDTSDIEVCADIYVFGHSLDITDKDILYGFFSIETANIHVFAQNKFDEAEYIGNMIKIVKHEQLINRTYSDIGRIEFLEQKKMEKMGNVI